MKMKKNELRHKFNINVNQPKLNDEFIFVSQMRNKNEPVKVTKEKEKYYF